MKKIIFLLLTYIFISFPSANFKPKSEYWKDIELPYHLISDQLTNENCYRNEMVFVACLNMVNTIFSYHSPPLKLLPNVAGLDFPGKLEYYKDINHNILKPFMYKWTKTKSMIDIKRKQDFNRKLIIEWMALFDKKDSKKIDFSFFNKWTKNNITYKYSDLTNEIIAETYNSYIKIILSPHSRISPNKYDDDRVNNSKDVFYGIGAFVKKHFEIVIVNPIEGSAASKAGIMRGDILFSIDNSPTSGKSLDKIVEELRGDNGSKLIIEVVRNGKKIEKKFIITREKHESNNVMFKFINHKKRKFLYSKIRSFAPDNTCSKFKSGFDDHFKKDVISGLILDLRFNIGGMHKNALCLLDLFLEEGVLIDTVDYLFSEREDKMEFAKHGRLIDIPLVLILNSGSSSASELVAGVLQDHKKAFIIGERSYGKGTQLSLYDVKFSKDVTLWDISAELILPVGRSYQLVGIIPDFEVYSTPDPSEIDKYALREETEHFYTLPHIGEEYTNNRLEEIEKIKNCIEKNGLSRELYINEFKSDYQLLYATDVLDCYQIPEHNMLTNLY